MNYITVSGLLGANGGKIARKVSEELNYPYYGAEELLKAAQKMGFASNSDTVDENVPNFLERLFSEKPQIYLDHLQSIIYDVAKRGNAVFVGRGGKFLLHSFDCAFHVLVVGSMEKRIRRVMEENKVEEEVAKKIINRSDHDKRAFIRFAYDQDMLNPQLYDLVLNTDKLSVDCAAEMVLLGAKSEEIKSCGADSVDLLGKLSLHRKVESLFMEKGLLDYRLFFDVEDKNSVHLFGFVDTPEKKAAIEELVRGIHGVKNIKNDLAVFSGTMA